MIGIRKITSKSIRLQPVFIPNYIYIFIDVYSYCGEMEVAGILERLEVSLVTGQFAQKNEKNKLKKPNYTNQIKLP